MEFEQVIQKERKRADTLKERYPHMTEIEVDHEGHELVSQVKEIMLIFRRNNYQYIQLKADGR